MRRAEIRIESEAAFFDRARAHAKLADCGEAIPPSHVPAFEDLETFLRLLNANRVVLLRELKGTRTALSDLTGRLKRGRIAVSRDVRALERAGVWRVTEKTMPRHGRKQWITPLVREIQLTDRF
jgi:predicted transcriptional regulator